MTKSELVALIINTEIELDDNVDCAGYDWAAAAEKLESAKAELADRFGKAVGYGGILYSI